MKTFILLLVLAVCARVEAAPFQNLNFERANTNTVGFSNPLAPLDLFGPSTDLLPGWQVFRGTNLLTSIGFNRVSLAFVDTGGVTLADRDPIEGKFSLSVRVPGGLGNPEPFSLVQRGDIPAEAQFLAFTYQGLPFRASINGTKVSPELLNFGFTPTTFFADVSRFAGQNVELSFYPSRSLLSGPSGDHMLDAIAFVVPEPSTYALFILGVLVLAAARLRAAFCARRMQATEATECGGGGRPPYF